MTEERMIEIEQHARLYGSSNCWTGTSGTLAAMIMELLTELKRREQANVESLDESVAGH